MAPRGLLDPCASRNSPAPENGIALPLRRDDQAINVRFRKALARQSAGQAKYSLKAALSPPDPAAEGRDARIGQRACKSRAVFAGVTRWRGVGTQGLRDAGADLPRR